MYWLKTWADWYWDKIIMTTTKDTSVNFVCMTVSVKRYWKTIQEDVSYTGHKESSFQKLMTRRGVTQSSLQKPDTNYVYLLSSTQTLKAFYVNKARASHHYQILHHPIPTSPAMWKLHLCEIQWCTILWSTPSEYRGWNHWKVFGPSLSHSNHLYTTPGR